MFESGSGGDFATYVGDTTGTIYRLDLAKAHYLKVSHESLLAEAKLKEGRLSRLPEEIKCKICSIEFSAQSIPVDGEEFVEAYEL